MKTIKLKREKITKYFDFFLCFLSLITIFLFLVLEKKRFELKLVNYKIWLLSYFTVTNAIGFILAGK